VERELAGEGNYSSFLLPNRRILASKEASEAARRSRCWRSGHEVNLQKYGGNGDSRAVAGSGNWNLGTVRANPCEHLDAGSGTINSHFGTVDAGGGEVGAGFGTDASKHNAEHFTGDDRR
jgi:hypothetical protein